MGNAAGQGIAVVDGLLGGFHELVHDLGRRGNVGIAHTEVHHVDILPTQTHFQLADNGEDIRGQALDTGKLFHSDIS